MLFHATVYNVIISSPGDVTEERDAVTEAVYAWNAEHAAAFGIFLNPMRWETHASPKTGIRPQASINEEIVDHSDIMIALFWSRFGSPTGIAESGSIEEIDEFLSAGKRVMIYFSKKQLPNDVDTVQLNKVRDFRKQCHPGEKYEGIYHTFINCHELQSKVKTHLTSAVRELRDTGIETTAIESLRDEAYQQPSPRDDSAINKGNHRRLLASELSQNIKLLEGFVETIGTNDPNYHTSQTDAPVPTWSRRHQDKIIELANTLTSDQMDRLTAVNALLDNISTKQEYIRVFDRQLHETQDQIKSQRSRGFTTSSVITQLESESRAVSARRLKAQLEFRDTLRIAGNNLRSLQTEFEKLE